VDVAGPDIHELQSAVLGLLENRSDRISKPGGICHDDTVF